MTATAQTSDFVISRIFDVPRDVLWKCFTDPERMKQWWGPKGFTVIASDMDLRIGGTYHYGMKAPDGSPMWGLFTYREIESERRLVFVNSFSDEERGVTRHPLHESWPLLMLSSFSFEDEPGGRTKFTVRWRTLDATPAEQKTFDENHPSMVQGWTGTMDQLETYLARATQEY